MGGLYCRYIFGNIQEIIGENVQLHAFITLATPHLGVEGLLGVYSPKFLSFFQTGRDLLLVEDNNWETNENHWLIKICKGSFIENLHKFQYRISYAPIFNDGFVSFPSAALQFKFPNKYPSGVSNMTQKIQVNDQGNITELKYGVHPPEIIFQTYYLPREGKNTFPFKS